jgi:hypothetical protein
MRLFKARRNRWPISLCEPFNNPEERGPPSLALPARSSGFFLMNPVGFRDTTILSTAILGDVCAATGVIVVVFPLLATDD